MGYTGEAPDTDHSEALPPLPDVQDQSDITSLPSSTSIRALSVGAEQGRSEPELVASRPSATLIAGIDRGTVTEDQYVQSGQLETSGQLTINDPDAGQDHFTAQKAVAGSSGLGHFSIDTTGHWVYSTDNTQDAIQHLKAGQHLTDSLVVTSADGTAHTIIVTIQGTNDAPVLQAQTQAVTEDGSLLSGHMVATDVDAGDTQTFSIAQPLDGFTLNADGSYRFDPSHATYQHLAAGQMQYLVIPITVTDSAGASSTRSLSITVTGTNDGPIIAGENTGSTAEDNSQAVNGQLTIADADDGQAHFIAQNGAAGTYGFFTLSEQGQWSYQLDNSKAEVQALKAGETVTDSFTITTADGTTHTVSITLSGRDDRAVIAGTDTGAITEDTAVTSGRLQASGQLTITDPDAGQAQFTAQSDLAGSAGLGLFSVDANGAWTYSADNSQTAIQQLKAGESLTDTLTVTSTDGTAHTVTVTLNGTNDAPVLQGQTRTTREDGGQLTGHMKATDVDAGDTQTFSLANVVDGFTLHDDGSYSFDPSHPSYQHLAAGQTQDLVIPITVTDAAGASSTQELVIKITGSNDGAVISGADRGNVTEDVGVNSVGKISASGSLSVSDPDVGEAIFAAQTGPSAQGYGGFVLGPSGNWTYVADNANPAIQALKAGDTLTDSFTVHSADGTAHTVNVTITGSNDAPTVAHALTNTTAAEDVAFSFGIPAGTFADLDTGDTLTLSASSLPAWLHFDAATGTFSGTPANGDVGTQHITVTATDGSGAQVSTTFDLVVSNTNDAPVLNSIASVRVTEDGAQATGHFTATDPDSGDTLTYGIGQPVDGLTVNADGSWSFDPGHAGYQHLAAGQTQTLIIPVTVTDAAGASSTQDLVIKITGSNDGAVISGADVGALTEDQTSGGGRYLQATGTLSVSDLDVGETVFQAGTSIGHYGELVLHGDGQWMYQADNANPAVQALKAGEQATDTFTVKSADGTSHSVTLTITGTNDVPTVVHALSTTTAAEDAAFSFGVPKDTFADIDSGDTLTLSTGTLPAWLHFDAATGLFSGTPANGDVGTTPITVTATDGSGAQVSTTFDLVVSNTNDAPVLNSIASVRVTEDGAQATGHFTAIDPDSGDTLTYGIGQPVDGLTVNADGSWSFDPGHASYQHLAAGQTQTLIIPVTVTDAAGASSTQDLVIKITGSNDGAVISGTDVGALTEDQTAGGSHNLQATGSLSVSDVDVGEAVFQAGTSTGHYGELVLHSDGQWKYQADNASPAVQALKAGEQATESFTVHSADGTAHTITVTLTGANDGAVISGADRGDVTEDVGVNSAGKISASGSLIVSDPDAGEAVFAAQTGPSTQGYGGFVLGPSGNWTYVADNANPAIQALKAGDTLTDSFTVHSADGTTHTVNVTIHGSNDGAVISGTDRGDLKEDVGVNSAGKISASGTLSVSDPDAGEAVFTAQTGPSAQGYGGFVLGPSGNWTYVADNANPAIQALKEGDTLTDSFTVHSADGTTHTVNVTIHGTNDAPGIGATRASARFIGEDSATTTITGLLHSRDGDAGDTLSWSVSGQGQGKYGHLDFDPASGNWTYRIDNADADTNALAAGQRGEDVFQITATDSSGASASTVVRVLVSGANDGAVIGGVSTATVTEDTAVTTGKLQASGQLTVSDVDTGEAQFMAQTELAGSHGTFSLATDGHWTFTVDNTYTVIQALKPGDTLTYSFNVRSLDGTTHIVSVTVQGTNDAPVLAAQTQAVTEDGTQLTGHMVATDADAGDTQTFSIAQPVDGFTLNADGSYSFDPSHASYQHLAAGQTQDVVIPITVTDSAGATSTQNLTITVSGSNDGPLVTHGTAATAADLGAINEDAPRVFTEAELLQAVGASDVDDGAQLHIVAGSLTSAHGTFSGDAAHGFTFTPAANFSGQNVALQFSVTDGTASREAFVTLDITPVADAPDRLAGKPLSSNFDDAAGAAGWQPKAGRTLDLEWGSPVGGRAVVLTDRASDQLHQELDTVAGQRVHLSFDVMATQHSRASLQVLWEGKVVADVFPKFAEWETTHTELDLVATGPNSRLEFRTASDLYSAGNMVRLDNVNLRFDDIRSDRVVVSNQDLRLSLDSEFRLTDTDGSESVHYLIKGLPVGFTLTDGTHSVTVGQADQEIDTRGWQQEALSVQAPHDYIGAVDLQVTARSEEAGNAQTADSKVLPMRLNFESADQLKVAEDTAKTFSADKLLALAGLVPPHGQHLSLSDVQVDATFGHFSHNSDGSWTFTPAANVSADQVPITLTATGGARPLTASLSLAITPVVDTPVGGLTVQTDFDHQSVGHDGWAYVDGAGMGWHTDYAKGIQVGQDKLYGGTSSTNQIVELVANAGSNIYRDLPTTAGQALHFGFDLSARAGNTVATLEVVWEGKVIDTIKPGSAFSLVHHDYDLVATGANSRIELRATGGDGRSIIDNIAISPPPQVALVNHALHLDVGQAFQLADTDGSETISYLINGLPVGFTLSDGSHSVTATTAGQQLDLKGWQLDSLVLQSPADFEGQLVLKVSARAEEGATHESATSSELPLQLSFERLTTAEDTPRSFSERELLQLAGVLPAVGEHLSVSDVHVDPAFGQVTHNADGSWTFTPAANVSADQVALNLTVAGGAQSQQVALPLQISAVTDAPLLGDGVSTSDFEQQRVTDRSGSQFLDPGKYGWHSDGAGGVEVGPEASFGGSRAGNQVVELISRAAGTNDPNLYRDLTTEPGQRLLFAFDLSRRAGWAVGPVEVLWEGKVIDTITPTDSGFAFHHHAYDLVATGTSARLELRVLGDTVDQRAILDNLYIGPPPQLALVNHELHLKLESYFQLADTDGSESLSYLIKGLPVGFTLSDGSHSVTVTAADQVIDTQGWQQDALSVQAPKDFAGTLDLSISGRSEEGSNHQTATSAELPLRLSFESLATPEDTPLTFSESKLLALSGVVPGAGEHLSLSDVQVDAAFGQITHNADGSWTFTPAANVSADQVALQLTVAGGTQPITTSLPLSITPVVDAPVLAWQPVQPDIASQHVGSEGWAYFDPSQVGWHSDNHQGVYIGTAKRYGGADDHRILELAGIADAPMNFYRTLDTQAGQTLRFSFDMTGRPGRPPAVIEVLFEGKVIDTLTPDNQSYAMQHHEYELTATGPNSRIELRAQAQDGNHRALIDHIEVLNQPQLEALVNHDIQLELGRYVALADTDGSETISYQIQGLPVGFTLSDGSHSVTVTAAGQVIDTRGWQQDALHVQAPKDFSGTLDLSVTGRSEEGANHQSAISAVQYLRLSFESLATTEDTPLTLSESKLLALAGVEPVAGEHLSLGDVQVDAAFGQFSHNADGSWTFTPAANVNADQVPFTLTVTGGSQPVSASLQLSITPVNDAPVLSAATAAATEDGAPLTGHLLATDPDAGDTQTFSLANAVDGFTLNADGSYRFDPSHASYQHLAAGQTQDVVIPITVTDSTGLTSTQNLTITLTGSNDGPLVTNGTAATAADLGTIHEDATRVFTEAELLQAVGASDVDDGAQMHIVAGSLTSAHGTFSGDAAHGYTFTPAANFSGQDVDLQFSVTDGTVSREAHAQLDITPVADAPVRGPGLSISTDFNSVDVGAGGWKLSDPTPLGWHSSEPSGVEIGQEWLYGGSGNNQILSLTASWSSNIYRDLATQAGQTVHVGFDLSARPGFAMTPVEVLWEGKVIDTISPTAGVFSMQHHSYDLLATGGNSRLEFRATGQGEARALFDNIQIGAPDHLTLGDQDILLKPYLGYQLADTDGSETLSYAIHGLPVGFTLTDGTQSTTVASAGQVIETTGWNQETLALRAPHDFHGDVSIQVTARAEEGSSHQTASAADLTLHLSGLPVSHVAVIAGQDSGSVMEDYQVTNGRLESFGKLTINDPDAGEAKFDPQNAVGTTYGRYTIDQLGNWLYTADNSSDVIQKLKTSEHLTDSFTVHSADGTAHTISVTIQGQDDAPVFVPHAGPTRSDDAYSQIGQAFESMIHQNFKYLGDMMLHGADTYPFERAVVVIKNAGVSFIAPDGSVAQAFAPHGGTLTEVPIAEMIAWHAKGAGYQVVFTDAKASEIGVYAHNSGNPGMLSGRAPYSDWVLHPEQSAAQLTPVMHDVAAASSGAAVQGAAVMPPTIAPLEFDSAHVLEDNGQQIAGFIEVKDADAGQSSLRPQTDTATHYGRFSIDANGDWAYQLDNNRPEIQQLGDGQTLVDTITVHSADGTAHEVNITIHGQNDGAVIAGADSGHVQLGISAVAQGQLQISDVDSGQAGFALTALTGNYGSLGIDTQGNWQYILDGANSAVHQLSSQDTLTDHLTVHSLDGTAHSIDIQISGDPASVQSGGQPSVVQQSLVQLPVNPVSGTDIYQGLLASVHAAGYQYRGLADALDRGDLGVAANLAVSIGGSHVQIVDGAGQVLQSFSPITADYAAVLPLRDVMLWHAQGYSIVASEDSGADTTRMWLHDTGDMHHITVQLPDGTGFNAWTDQWTFGELQLNAPVASAPAAPSSSDQQDFDLADTPAGQFGTVMVEAGHAGISAHDDGYAGISNVASSGASGQSTDSLIHPQGDLSVQGTMSDESHSLTPVTADGNDNPYLQFADLTQQVSTAPTTHPAESPVNDYFAVAGVDAVHTATSVPDLPPTEVLLDATHATDPHTALDHTVSDDAALATAATDIPDQSDNEQHHHGV